MAKTVPVNGLSAACPLCGATRFLAESSQPMLDEPVACAGCGSRYTYGFLVNRQTAPIEQGPSSRTPALDELVQEIARLAYFRAQNRGFAPGREQQDWLEAEAAVLRRD